MGYGRVGWGKGVGWGGGSGGVGSGALGGPGWGGWWGGKGVGLGLWSLLPYRGPYWTIVAPIGLSRPLLDYRAPIELFRCQGLSSVIGNPFQVFTEIEAWC